MILCGERADDTAVGLCPGNLLKIQWRFVASLIKFDREALIDWGAVAIVHRPLGIVIDSSGLRVEWQHRPLEGGWLREVGIGLSSGRCAYLAETRTAPGEFTLHLERYRDQFYFREDFGEVRQFLGLADADTVVLTGQVRWWKKKLPATGAQNREPDRVTPPPRSRPARPAGQG